MFSKKSRRWQKKTMRAGIKFPFVAINVQKIKIPEAYPVFLGFLNTTAAIGFHT